MKKKNILLHAKVISLRVWEEKNIEKEERVTRCDLEIGMTRSRYTSRISGQVCVSILALANRNDEIRRRERDPYTRTGNKAEGVYAGTLDGSFGY